MSYEFKVVPHLIHPGSQMIECWRDGVFVAGIYPHEDGLRVVSKYMTEVTKGREPVMAQGVWLPSAIIKLGKKSVK